MVITHSHDLMGLVDLILTIIQIIIIIVIISVFWKNYTASKSHFSMGLILFASMFLINQIVYLASFVIYAAYFYFIIDVLGLIGFLILLKLVLK